MSKDLLEGFVMTTEVKEAVQKQQKEETEKILGESAQKLMSEIGSEETKDRLLKYKIDNNTILYQGRPCQEDLPWVFSADKLTQQDRDTRKLAKAHNINILDVDKIYSVFSYFDADGSGEIEFEEFRDLLSVLFGNASDFLPEKKVKALWLTLDTDHSGSSTFPEFLVWYFYQYGAPSASSIRKGMARLGDDSEPQIDSNAQRASFQKMGTQMSLSGAGGIRKSTSMNQMIRRDGTRAM